VHRSARPSPSFARLGSTSRVGRSASLTQGEQPTDTRERYPFRFVQQNVETIRHAGVEKNQR
jgi:hypothetical protein